MVVRAATKLHNLWVQKICFFFVEKYVLMYWLQKSMLVTSGWADILLMKLCAK